jgi:hypothetical protein
MGAAAERPDAAAGRAAAAHRHAPAPGRPMPRAGHLRPGALPLPLDYYLHISTTFFRGLLLKEV